MSNMSKLSPVDSKICGTKNPQGKQTNRIRVSRKEKYLKYMKGDLVEENKIYI